jgi:hypothetical protein
VNLQESKHSEPYADPIQYISFFHQACLVRQMKRLLQLRADPVLPRLADQ